MAGATARQVRVEPRLTPILLGGEGAGRVMTLHGGDDFHVPVPSRVSAVYTPTEKFIRIEQHTYRHGLVQARWGDYDLQVRVAYCTTPSVEWSEVDAIDAAATSQALVRFMRGWVGYDEGERWIIRRVR